MEQITEEQYFDALAIVREYLAQILYEIKLPVQVIDKINLADIDISVKTFNALSRAGIHTIGDLKRCAMHDLMRLRGFGTKSLKEVENLLETYHLTFTPL